MNNLIIKIAKLTRMFHPKGTQRIISFFYSPDKRQNDFLETIIPYDKTLKIHINTGSPIEWMIFFKGYYDLKVINLIKKYLPKGGVFVDVGAHIGTHSLVASKIADKVIAIEPDEKLCERMRKNCELNKINNISIAPIRISDKDEGNAKTLDEVLKDEERVDLIQIDTIGYDGKVVLSSSQTILIHHPIIIFEYSKTSWPAEIKLEDILEFLEPYYNFSRTSRNENGFNVLCLPK